MDLYEGCAKLFNHLTATDWSEDAASSFVDALLRDHRTRVERESALAWACYEQGCLEVIGGAHRPAQVVQPLRPGRYVRIGKDATVWVSQ